MQKQASHLKKSSVVLDVPTLGLLVFMHVLFIGNFILYFNRPLPVLLHTLLAVAAIHLAFTIWHEAAHGNVSNRGWVNHMAGFLGIFPYMAPFFASKWIHLEHHKHLNEKEDPNRLYIDGPFWKLPLRYIRGIENIKDMVRQNPLPRREKISDSISSIMVLGIYAAALYKGVFWDFVLLWFIPFLMAKVIMDWYVNYIPHVGLKPDRFLGTRIIQAPWLTPLILGHNYHAIHHLWPRYPWHRYIPVFKEKQNYLQEKGVPFQKTIFTVPDK